MIGLMTRRESSAALAMAPADHKNHCGFFGHEIKQDVAVDEYGRHLLTTSQRHDLVSAHRNVSASSQVRDEPRAASLGIPLFGSDNAYGLAIEFEVNLGVGKKACPFADFDGNGHLALGSNAHLY
jgi:hypothetical protein